MVAPRGGLGAAGSNSTAPCSSPMKPIGRSLRNAAHGNRLSGIGRKRLEAGIDDDAVGPVAVTMPAATKSEAENGLPSGVSGKG